MSSPAFSDALRAVSVAASERTGGVKLGVSQGTMRITTESPDSGEGFDEVPIEYAGASMTIGFNAQYHLDFLGAAGTETVSREMKDGESQGVLRPKGEGPTDYRYVVMPMRL